MPKYFGGKALICKGLWRFLKSQIGDDRKKTFFEPFCGMLNIGFLALEDGFTCLFNDINPDVIRMWNGLKDGWRPPETISKEEYLKLKVAEDSILRSYAGYAYAYMGTFFSGYDTTQKNKTEPFKRGILRVVPYLEKCTFTNKSYLDFNPKGMIIYCDPPYRGYDCGQKYFKFDSDLFWNKMREWSKDNTVFISEYEAPDDFRVVWERDVKITTNACGKTIKKIRHEKLFKYNKL